MQQGIPVIATARRWNKEVINKPTCPAADQSAIEFRRVRNGALTLSNYTEQNAKLSIIILPTFNQCISTRAGQSGLLVRSPVLENLLGFPTIRAAKRPHDHRSSVFTSLHQPIEKCLCPGVLKQCQILYRHLMLEFGQDLKWAQE